MFSVIAESPSDEKIVSRGRVIDHIAGRMSDHGRCDRKAKIVTTVWELEDPDEARLMASKLNGIPDVFAIVRES